MMQTAAGLVKATQGLLEPTHPLTGTWTQIPAPSLPRSSHTISVVAGRAYIFGGEIQSHDLVDNSMHILILPSATVTSADYQTLPSVPLEGNGPVPKQRVGHSAAVIGERIFFFGGCSGKDMKPIDEKGRMWIFDTRTSKWTFLDPVEGSPYPEARSYHCSVSIPKPEPSALQPVATDNFAEEPAIGKIAERAKASTGSSGYGTFFVHAGCLAEGRANDLWGFDVPARLWRKYPDAPGEPRGGAAITVSKHRIYRYGGYDGHADIGGKLDVLDLALETFDDKGGVGELGVSARSTWDTLNFEEEDMTRPPNRSIAGLHTITTGMGREYLILLLGEGNPSKEGQDGAGSFDDVWAFQAPPQGMTGASFKDAAWQALGRETGEGFWSQVRISGPAPGGRRWFASSTMGDLSATDILIWGGLNANNEHEDNGWVVTFK